MGLKPALYTASSESVQRAANADSFRSAGVFWTIGPALGLLQALALRNSIDHDAVAYLDMADRFLHGRTAHITERLLEPAVPVSAGARYRLCLALLQATALHLVNFAIYLLVLLSFDFFLIGRAANFSRRIKRKGHACLGLCAGALVRPWILTSLGQSHPDLLVVAAVFFAAGITAAARSRRNSSLVRGPRRGARPRLPRQGRDVSFGVCVPPRGHSAGSTAGFVRAAVLLAFAVLTFALIAGAYGYMLSRAEQRFTLGGIAPRSLTPWRKMEQALPRSQAEDFRLPGKESISTRIAWWARIPGSGDLNPADWRWHRVEIQSRPQADAACSLDIYFSCLRADPGAV